MELPIMIVKEVKRLEHNDFVNSKCEIIFEINESNFKIEIFPWKLNCIYLRYNDVNFKCISLEKFEEIMRFFINYFFDRNNANVYHRIEWDNYNPDTDDDFDKLVIRIINSKQCTVFYHYYNDKSNENIQDMIYNDLKIMYYMVTL